MLNIYPSLIRSEVIRSESKCFELIQENEKLPKHNLNKIIAELSKTIGSNKQLTLIDHYLVGRVKNKLGKTDYSGIAGAIKKFAHSFVNWFKLGEFTTTDKYINKLQEKTHLTSDNKKIIKDLTTWAKSLTPGNKEEAINRILTALLENKLSVNLTDLNLDPQDFPKIKDITLLHANFNQKELKEFRDEDNQYLQEFERKNVK